MSLIFTEEQNLIRQTVREFAENEVRPRVVDMVKTNQFPRDLYKRCGELGFWRLNIPVENGGAGMGMVEANIVMEELARVSPALALSVEIGIVGFPLLPGTAMEQYLEPLMSGDLVICGAASDPKGQSNQAEWTPMAVSDGDDYILNGTKCYVTNAAGVDVAGVNCLTDEGEIRKIFVFKEMCPGIDNSQIDQKYGMAGTGGGTLVFKDCRVPKALSVPTAIGTSVYYYTIYAACAAEALGCAEGIFEKAVEFCKLRTHDFKPLSEMQAVRHKLAQMKAKLEVARSAVYDVSFTYDAIKESGDQKQLDEWAIKAESIKVWVSEMAVDIATECCILHGGMGYHDPAIHHYVGDSLCYTIMDLTNEIHYDNMARLMGL